MNHLEQVRDYWNKRSNGFSSAINEEADSELGVEWRARFTGWLGEKPLEILDDGAGPGFFTLLLTQLGHRVTSIDYSEQMLEHLRDNLAARGYAANALRMDAQALAFPDACFDAVVQRNVLWNLDHPEQAIREIHRMLRPGGTFILSDGNFYLASHDAEYAAERERRRQAMAARAEAQPRQPGDHNAHNQENVNFTIIEKIAEEQPLSRVRRPQWDLDQLIRLGFYDIEISIQGDNLPQGFILVAKKRAV